MSVLVGVDLGQSRDPSTVAVIEKESDRYVLRRLERLPLRTSYPRVVQHIQDLVGQPRLRGCTLIADATGCGRPVLDLMRDAHLPCPIVPVTITGGVGVSHDQEGWRVCKRDLVLSLVVAVQTKRLVAPKDLPLGELLAKELENFEVRMSAAGNETFAAGRETAHDDLVLACALAIWWGEYRHPQLPVVQGDLVLNLHRPGEERENDPFARSPWGPMSSWGDF